MREFNLDARNADIPTYGMSGTDTAADALFGTREQNTELFANTFMGKPSASLKLEALKREGIRVLSNGADEYNLVLPTGITSSAVHKLVSSLNPEIEVLYSEEMEEQANLLAKKTKKPIWGFSTDGNTVTLKRTI